MDDEDILDDEEILDDEGENCDIDDDDGKIDIIDERVLVPKTYEQMEAMYKSARRSIGELVIPKNIGPTSIETKVEQISGFKPRIGHSLTQEQKPTEQIRPEPTVSKIGPKIESKPELKIGGAPQSISDEENLGEEEEYDGEYTDDEEYDEDDEEISDGLQTRAILQRKKMTPPFKRSYHIFPLRQPMLVLLEYAAYK